MTEMSGGFGRLSEVRPLTAKLRHSAAMPSATEKRTGADVGDHPSG
jgi:hypothetical protein